MFSVTGNLRSPILALFVVLVVFLIGIPSDPAFQLVLTTGAAYALAAIGNDLMTGYGALPNIGQGAFIAIGAYASSILIGTLGWPFWLSAVGAIVGAGAVALVIGAGGVRLAHVGLAVTTFAFAFVVYVLLYGSLLQDVVGSANGLVVPPGSIFGLDLTHANTLFALSCLTLAIAVVVLSLLIRSRWGHALMTVKRSEALATSIGINAYAIKLGAFMVAAMCAAAGGVILAQGAGFISPEGYPITLGIVVFAIAAVGGFGTISGPVFAAFAYVIVLDYGSTHASAGLWWPALLLVVLMFSPAGAYGLLTQTLRLVGLRRRAPQTQTPDSAPPIETGVPGEEPSPLAVDEGREPILMVDDVTLKYGGVAALRSVSFKVETGSIHALVGPNGAGKTSLLDVLTGVADPTNGTVHLKTTSLLDVPARRRSAVGLARSFQHPALVGDLTVLQNVTLGANLRQTDDRKNANGRRTHAKNALLAAGVHTDMWALLPADLSGGHQKLVDLARALAAAPDLLLLDEPTSGITDAEGVVLAGAILRARDAGCSVLVIDHNVNFVRRIAARTTVLDYGSVIADGSTEAVLNDPEVIAAFVGTEVPHV